MQLLSPQSQRYDPKMSPVAHDEWTRTNTGSSSDHSPFRQRDVLHTVGFLAEGRDLKSPQAVGSGTVTPFSMSDSSRSR